MKQVWVVHYQEPIGLGPNPGTQVERKYKASALGFRSKMDAVWFLDELKKKPWYDPSVCYLDGPIEVR